MEEWTLIDSIKYKRKVYNIYKRAHIKYIHGPLQPTFYKIETRDCSCSIIDVGHMFSNKILLSDINISNQSKYTNIASDLLEFVELFVEDKIYQSGTIEASYRIEGTNPLVHLHTDKGYHAEWFMCREQTYARLTKTI